MNTEVPISRVSSDTSVWGIHCSQLRSLLWIFPSTISSHLYLLLDFLNIDGGLCN